MAIPFIGLNHRPHFTITLISLIASIPFSDHAAPAQLYRGNLPHYHLVWSACSTCDNT
jgi:hypothetical protein